VVLEADEVWWERSDDGDGGIEIRDKEDEDDLTRGRRSNWGICK